MRAAVTGAVDFTGCEVAADALLGEPGDYLREPDFSAGAWRGSAVASGGLIALLEHAITQLRDPAGWTARTPRPGVGQAFIARETCRLWVQAAARDRRGSGGGSRTPRHDGRAGEDRGRDGVP